MPHAWLRTLLCVEDNPANRKLVEELIARRPDLRLLTAVNGTVGIERARASQPEMILMDVNLPDISGIEAMKVLREDPVTAHIPIVALSANAMPRDIKKGLEAGFFRYLTKPIKVNEFMDTLRMALEFAEQRAVERGCPLEIHGFTLAVTVKAEPPPAPAPRTTGLRILVAEDHPVNQEVAKQILQRLGHHVVVAADGHAVLAALEHPGRGAFDLVLMDLEMPVMAGLEATAAIRDAERASGTHLPIVALTAHAMQGDRERYLEAGMDGYVMKPIDAVELARVIDQVVPPPAAPGTVAAAAVPVAPRRRLGPPSTSEPSVRGWVTTPVCSKRWCICFLKIAPPGCEPCGARSPQATARRCASPRTRCGAPRQISQPLRWSKPRNDSSFRVRTGTFLSRRRRTMC